MSDATSNVKPKIALGPLKAPEWMAEAIISGGGELCSAVDASALIWGDARKPGELSTVLAENAHLDWIALPFAGIENFVHLIDDSRIWTCGKGVYSDPVAEMALTLALSLRRDIKRFSSAKTWVKQGGVNLIGSKVLILGGGGIAQSLLKFLAPFDCEVTVLSRSATPLEGASRVEPIENLHHWLPDVDVVFLALALTPQTQRIISRTEFELMKPSAIIINVARGSHIDTPDLIWALETKNIGGAGLDVTDPEPLSDSHPLFGFDNVIISPHTGNTLEMAVPLLSSRIEQNVARYARGKELIGLVDPQLGY